MIALGAGDCPKRVQSVTICTATQSLINHKPQIYFFIRYGGDLRNFIIRLCA
jgi:hypothetical protein